MSEDLTFKEYAEDCARTELNDEQYLEAAKRLYQFAPMFHGLIGLVTEIGEVLDTFKKHIYYGKELDEKLVQNITEETGDIMWYTAIVLREAANLQGITPQLILEKNIEKLKVRYPDKFNSTDALNRNTEEELKQI